MLDEEILIPEIDIADVEKLVEVNFIFNPHFVFSFLDTEGVFVSIMKCEGGFTYGISNTTISEIFTTRTEAEKNGALEGLKTLEEKL